ELSGVGMDVCFVVIGGPDDISLAEIQKEIDEQGVSPLVFLAGEQENILEWLCAADIYLSTARWEGLPTAVLEAMSLGLPVVAGDVVGNKSVIKNGINGFLVSPDDPFRYVNALNEILNNPEIRERISGNALADITENYSLKGTVSAHERLYRELLK
ncbi:MAG: glycosyltransferase family 4 protein, partial [Spirochaetes bacterium]|nr:glycosyltransferase family 4 protein [Spirochaetota bacterium]